MRTVYHVAWATVNILLSPGKSLLKRYRAAMSDRNMQREAHQGLSRSLGRKVTDRWEALCSAWDSDGFPKSVVNPFHVDDRSKPPTPSSLITASDMAPLI